MTGAHFSFYVTLNEVKSLSCVLTRIRHHLGDLERSMKRLTHFQKTGRIAPPFGRGSLPERLIVFTRYPAPGKTKTRLIRFLGPEGAADLHRRMTERTVARVREVKTYRPVSIEIRYEGGEERLMGDWLGPDLSYHPQEGGDLGERMALAFRHTFLGGGERVVLVGTDCPGLTDGLLAEAFESLRHTDVVLGPARDGGYYLIGLRKTIDDLFVDMPWGTEEVLDKTRQVAEGLGLSVRLLEALGDVDRPEDLPLWREASQHQRPSSPSPRISIIIPTLNEADNIAETLASTHGAPDVEVIVVDGGSTDKTAGVARSRGAKVIIFPPGRASQMNAGAAVAKGEVLLFLHGDTRLPSGFDRYVFQTLARPSTVAGAFRLRIDGNLLGLRTTEKMANLRSRRLQLPYGDQGIFLKADLFREMGGFANMPIMEDFEMVRRLRRRGRIVTAPVSILTSGRRWEKLGVLRVTLINFALPLAYYLGVSPTHLAHWYRRKPFKLLKSFDSFKA